MCNLRCLPLTFQFDNHSNFESELSDFHLSSQKMTLTQLTGQLKQYSEPNGDAMNPNQPLLPLAHPQPQQAIIKEQRIDPNYSRTHNSKATFASFCCSKGMSLFLSIFIISVSLAILIVELTVFTGMSDSNYQTTQIKLGVRLGLSIPGGLAIVYYIILIFTCGTFKYIMNNNNAENTYNFIDQITEHQAHHFVVCFMLSL